MSSSIEDIINNGTIDFKDGDKVVIKKGGYVVTIRKKRQTKRQKIADKNWVLTAYDESASDGNSAITKAFQGKAALTTDKSARIVTTSSAADQTNGEKKQTSPTL